MVQYLAWWIKQTSFPSKQVETLVVSFDCAKYDSLLKPTDSLPDTSAGNTTPKHTVSKKPPALHELITPASNTCKSEAKYELWNHHRYYQTAIPHS